MADIKKCTGLTKTSKPCNNKALIGKDFCQVHDPKINVPKIDIEKNPKKEYKKFEGFSEAERCKYFKKDGEQCKRRGTDNGYCDKHRVSNELSQLVTKTCRECKKTKDIKEFRKNRGECVDCERASGRKYRQDNKEIAQKWTEENREHHNKLKSDWTKSHRDHINEKVRTRMHEDEYYKISKNYRSNLPTFLCGNSKKCKELVDCEKDFFVGWIKDFWEHNMTMENYGKDWVLDHVIPLHTDKEEFYTTV